MVNSELENNDSETDSSKLKINFKLLESQENSNDFEPDIPTNDAQVAMVLEPYKFFTRKGDSITKIARKAIQEYASNNKLKLSPSQKAFMENTLANKRNNVKLVVNQEVTFQAKELDYVYQNSLKLNPNQIKAWQKYAQRINFSEIA